MSANRAMGLSEETPEPNELRSGRACSPPVPGPPTTNNTQVTREGTGSNLGYILKDICIVNINSVDIPPMSQQKIYKSFIF